MSCEQKWCLSIPVQSIKAFTIIYPREILASWRQDLQVIPPSLALWSPTHQWRASPYWMRNKVMFCKTVELGVSSLALNCCYCSVTKSCLTLWEPTDAAHQACLPLTIASSSASVLPVNIQGWFPLGLTCLISFWSKGFSRVFSSTTIQKNQFFRAQPSSWSNSHSCTYDYCKNHSFYYTDLCRQSDAFAF